MATSPSEPLVCGEFDVFGDSFARRSQDLETMNLSWQTFETVSLVISMFEESLFG